MRRRAILLLRVFGSLPWFAAAAAAAADVCTIVVTARAGDTCASLSDAAGITVSQFLRANPGVTTCSALSTGTRYCVDPNFSTVPTSSSPSRPPTSPGGGLEVSKNGQCGPGLTCAGSSFGDCCSEHGWCGSSPDHCGSKCQQAFGKCGSPGNSQPASNVVTPTNPPNGGGGEGATTIYVTKTITAPALATATATQIVRQTVTEVGNGIATSTVVVTSTQHSLVFISSTVTTIRTITITDAKQCRTVNVTPLPRAVARATAVPGVPKALSVEGQGEERGAGPTPLQPEVVNDCELPNLSTRPR